ncbi:MAG: DsbA family protein [Corynebacterium sp.]|nr:DsbA family protein [Corynebacterium sp.]
MTQSVSFWFDVTCPFAWATSRWIKEVEKVRDVEVEFIPMSLSVLNEDNDIPADYAQMMEAAWGPARVFAYVKTVSPDKVDELYTIMGELIHGNGEGGKKGYDAYEEIVAQALDQVGLDKELAELGRGDTADEALRAFHARAIDAVGSDVGTPVVKLGDTAFFGPVITRIPTGEEAGELFDASVRLAQYPYFFELKRTRTEKPQVKN